LGPRFLGAVFSCSVFPSFLHFGFFCLFLTFSVTSDLSSLRLVQDAGLSNPRKDFRILERTFESSKGLSNPRKDFRILKMPFNY
jgi:hypothetical protein